MASDERSGLLLGKPIDIDDLCAGCATYDRYTKKAKLADGELNAYNAALAHYREVVGVRIDDEETLHRIDLGDELQIRVLIDVFLNPWGCRLPRWDSPKRRERVVGEIRRWWEGLRGEGAVDGLPRVDERLAAAESDLRRRTHAYEELATRLGQGSGADPRRPAAASKILYILRPHFFLPWDQAIREKLRAGAGTGEQYAKFLALAQKQIVDLLGACGGEEELLAKVDQRGWTIVEALNKYCWSESRV